MVEIAPVSVVIPCFNCEATLGRALDSILAQTLYPSEVILVDDCSQDGTAALAASYALVPGLSVKYIKHDVNKGAAAARNTGIDAATYAYVAFLDSDDTWHPQKLRSQYDFMQAHLDVLLCGHRVELQDGKNEGGSARIAGHRTLSLQDLLLKNHLSTPSVMMRRCAYRFEPTLRYAEDIALWLKMSTDGVKLVYIDALLGYVHKPFYGAGGLSSSIFKMERGELRNYQVLYRRGAIPLSWLFVASSYSLAKFARRLTLTWWRNSVRPIAA